MIFITSFSPELEGEAKTYFGAAEAHSSFEAGAEIVPLQSLHCSLQYSVQLWRMVPFFSISLR